MEWEQLSDFIQKENSTKLKINYLYFSENLDDSFNFEINLNNLFLVTEQDDEKVEVLNLASCETEKINISLLIGNWWLLRIPDYMKKNFI
jgi:hypothetical protein